MSFPRVLRTALLPPALTIVITGAALAQQPARPAQGDPQAAQVNRSAQAVGQAAQPTRPTRGSAQGSGSRAAQTPSGTAANPVKSAAPAKPAAPAAPTAGPAGSGAALVFSAGDWGVYTAQAGRSKICYALSQPKDRQPKSATRDPAYLFVSFRPAENVRNEVALVMGFTTRENGAAEATVGSAKYALITKGQNAWLKNPAEEGQAITTMARGQTILVKAQSARGNQLTDQYSLSGFGPALERARKECS